MTFLVPVSLNHLMMYRIFNIYSPVYRFRLFLRQKMVPSKHLKRCDKIPNIFSTVFRHLDSLQLKILISFDNFLCEYQPDLLSKCIISNYMYVIMNRLLTIGQWLRMWKISFILLLLCTDQLFKHTSIRTASIS